MKSKFLLITILNLLISVAWAQESKVAPVVPEPKIKTGVIATSGVRIGSSDAVSVNTNDDVPGDKVNAISGGVSNEAGKCSANLTNANTEKAYRVRFDVVGKSERGSVSTRKNFSGTIPPSGKLVKEFNCAKGIELELNLKSVEPVK